MPETLPCLPMNFPRRSALPEKSVKIPSDLSSRRTEEIWKSRIQFILDLVEQRQSGSSTESAKGILFKNVTDKRKLKGRSVTDSSGKDCDKMRSAGKATRAAYFIQHSLHLPHLPARALLKNLVQYPLVKDSIYPSGFLVLQMVICCSS